MIGRLRYVYNIHPLYFLNLGHLNMGKIRPLKFLNIIIHEFALVLPNVNFTCCRRITNSLYIFAKHIVKPGSAQAIRKQLF